TGVGCRDCFSWCAASTASCNSSPLMRTYCKKSCNFCPSTEGACVNKGCDQRCLAQTGSEPVCACFEGYRLAPNNRTCLDIDECAENVTLCVGHPHGRNCNNTIGAYACTACEVSNTRFSYYERADCCKMSSESCGKSSTNGGRVVGGKRARVARWPWMAYITIGNNLCGGSLISSRWVVSAAHCFSLINRNNLGGVTVVLGVVDTLDRGNVHEQTFTISRLIIHPNYRFPDNDIALLELSREINPSIYVKPACLPNGEHPPVGEKCWATGYGTTLFGGATAKNLQEVDLPIADDGQCYDIYANRTNRFNPTNMLCAGYITGGKDACQGDSGGPLVCQRCKNCDWYLAGVTSFGKGCATPGFFGVYTKVSRFEQWISTYTNIPVSPQQCVKPSWTQWGQWTNCASCSGRSSRIRFCVNGSPGDPGCDGPEENFRPCSSVCVTATWGEYGQWSSCSSTCGGGLRMRSRSCVGGSIGSAECPTGGETATQSCNTGIRCPTWTRWSDWGECSLTCGGGTQTSTRTCNTFGQAGATCVGRASRSQICNDVICPSWAGYGSWSSCSRTCGGGTRTRSRGCSNGNVGQDGCPTSGATQSQLCNTQACQSAQPTWSDFGSWSGCSTTCGVGSRSRTRVCIGGSIGVVGCEAGGESATQSCNTGIRCPTWTRWSDWGECSLTCGGGTQTSTRTCNTFGQAGATCVGRASRSQICNQQTCPSWSAYGSWSICSSTCGGGSRSRSRTCNNGQIGNIGCSPASAASQSMVCNTNSCPQWTAWVAGSCSVTCGTGTRPFTRTCNTFGVVGASCGNGPTEQSEACTLPACPEFSPWSTWGSCSLSCSGGVQTRTRTCPNPGSCSGDAFGVSLTDSQPCNTPACLGVWGEWVNSGSCSFSCGPGTIQQTRQCIGGTVGQPNCMGATQQQAPCNLGVCTWSSWQAWTTCSLSCGGGSQSRTRTCSGGAGRCTGDATSTQSCNTGACSTSPCSNKVNLAALAECRSYATLGYCISYSVYMLQNCAYSCCLIEQQTNSCLNLQDYLGFGLCASYRHLCTEALIQLNCPYTCRCT
uniref:Peptidase S1 domain-containing protein n=1 Tax=Ciona savignyi TaxID=51511 RepID=H2ZIH0_CIOSA